MLTVCVCSTVDRDQCHDYTIRVGAGMKEKGFGSRESIWSPGERL
jgi:hypothetical protein